MFNEDIADKDNNPSPAAAAAAAAPPPNEDIEQLRRQLAEQREQIAVLIANQMTSTSGQSTGSLPFNAGSPDAHVKWQSLESRKAFLKSLFGRGSDPKQSHALAKTDIHAYRRLREEAQQLGCYGR